MARRRISITIDCGEKTCGDCHIRRDDPREGIYCRAFKAVLDLEGNKIDGETLRCAECLEHEEGRLD